MNIYEQTTQLLSTIRKSLKFAIFDYKN